MSSSCPGRSPSDSLRRPGAGQPSLHPCPAGASPHAPVIHAVRLAPGASHVVSGHVAWWAPWDTENTGQTPSPPCDCRVGHFIPVPSTFSHTRGPLPASRLDPGGSGSHHFPRPPSDAVLCALILLCGLGPDTHNSPAGSRAGGR